MGLRSEHRPLGSRAQLLARIGARTRRSAAALAAACIACGGGDRSAGSGRLYVTSGLTDEVLRLDPRDGRIVSRIPVDRRRGDVDEPHGITVAPDGRHWYVTLSHGEPTLWKFELPDDRLVGRLALETYGAARIGITPDGRRAFIPDYYRSGQGRQSGLAVVELADLTIVDRPTICAAPHDAQVDPSGRWVAVACSLSDEVVVMDAVGLGVETRFFVDPAPGPPGQPRFRPLNVVWSPDAQAMYVGLFAAGQVRAFDRDGDLLWQVAVGAGPAQMALTPDGRALVVANRNDRSVSLIEVPEPRERERVALQGAHPHGVALDEGGTIAYVTYEGDPQTRGGVVAIEIATGKVRWSVEAGIFTLGVAYARER